MKRCAWIVPASLLALASPAWAGDVLKTGAPPAWVVPVTAAAAKEPSGAIDFRLFDLQVRFDDKGMHIFTRQRMKVLRPEGLQGAGSAGLMWQPDFGDATVHSVTVYRGGQAIDALKDGKGFQIIRRESGLESALLDGVLTAVMQIPDVRVGDEVEMAYTVDTANPVLAGHVDSGQFIAEMPLTIDRYHVRYSWPASRTVRWQVGDRLPKPVAAKQDGDQVVAIDRTDFSPPKLPAGAPTRFLDANRLQFTDFADWAAVAALMRPLYDQAATLKPESPIRAEIKRIAESTSDPKARAAAALTLVQSQVRYFANATGLGGYKPVTADEVWAARNGDCKGKTVLLIALLRELGIQAEPALVSTKLGNGLDTALPMPSRFDHVIVRAVIDGKSYWLDGTRLGDRALDQIAVPAFEWALPVGTEGAELVALASTEPAHPTEEVALELDAREGLAVDAKAKGTAVFRGDSATDLRTMFTVVDKAQHDELLRRYWQDRYSWMTIDSVAYTPDDDKGEITLSFTGKAKMDWSNGDSEAKVRYEADGARLGIDLAPKRPADAPEAPVQVYQRYTLNRETILLPNGGSGFYVEGDPIDETIGGVHYRREASIKDGRFEMSASTRNRAAEIKLADAKTADSSTDKLFAKQLFIRVPYDYRLTTAELALAGGKKDGEGGGLVAAYALMQKHDPKGALAAVDAVLAKGKTADALTLRANVLMTLDRPDEADAAFDAALAIDPSHGGALWGKAERLASLGRTEDALILADRIVLRYPENARSYLLRAQLRANAGKREGALADYGIVVDKEPDNLDARIARVSLYNAAGDRTAALAEADAMVKVVPNSEAAHALRGNMLAVMGRTDEAKAALARSIEIEPSANAYATRLSFDLSGDKAGKLADVLAMIKLDATHGVRDGVMRELAADPDTRAQVTAAYAEAAKGKVGAEAQAIGDANAAFAAAGGDYAPMLASYQRRLKTRPGDAMLLNNACWFRATHRIELDQALKDCDAAIAINPAPGFLDSRGLVYLQRGEFAKAIGDYDAALGKNPDLPSSLFGRGLAKLRSGDAKGGEADLVAARKSSAMIDVTFADYGVKP